MSTLSEKKKEDWMNSKWRPMMGWSYMLTCICDFVIFPILWSLLQALDKGSVTIQWQPITLQGAGLYHIAMGAVLGVAAYGRTQEKLGGATDDRLQVSNNNSSIPVTNSWRSQPLNNRSSFENNTSSTEPRFSRSGKPMPAEPLQPEL